MVNFSWLGVVRVGARSSDSLRCGPPAVPLEATAIGNGSRPLTAVNREDGDSAEVGSRYATGDTRASVEAMASVCLDSLRYSCLARPGGLERELFTSTGFGSCEISAPPCKICCASATRSWCSAPGSSPLPTVGCPATREFAMLSSVSVSWTAKYPILSTVARSRRSSYALRLDTPASKLVGSPFEGGNLAVKLAERI